MTDRTVLDAVDPGGIRQLLRASQGNEHAFAAAVLAVGLALVHLYGARLRFVGVVPRSRLLSLGSGVSVAYVFVHLLPEVERTGDVVERGFGFLAFLDHHVYLVALLGFVAFYGLERFVARSRGDHEDDRPPVGVFWIHVGSFTVYNGVIGYLLFHREEPGIANLLLFAGAMGLHFLVNDYGLRHHHRDAYRRTGRWLLAGGILAGATVGAVTPVDPVYLGVLFAFVAGGIVLNVVKEELPERRESRFWAFALGSTLYAGVLVWV